MCCVTRWPHRCPRGTTSVRGAQTVGECMPLMQSDDFAILAVSALNENETASSPFVEVDSVTHSVSLKPFEFANISVDFSNLDNEIKYGDHWRMVILDYYTLAAKELPYEFVSTGVDPRRLFYMGATARRYCACMHSFDF